eukprot:scpid57623/ scgid9838/ 
MEAPVPTFHQSQRARGDLRGSIAAASHSLQIASHLTTSDMDRAPVATSAASHTARTSSPTPRLTSSNEDSVFCGLDHQQRPRVFSLFLSIVGASLLLSGCVMPTWLVRPSTELLLMDGSETVRRNSSAVTLGLFMICERSTLNTCFTYLSASSPEFRPVLWDVDYHTHNEQLIASQSLCVLSVLAALAAVCTIALQWRFRKTETKFRCLVVHALASLLTCFSCILSVLVFYFWSDEALRQPADSAVQTGDDVTGRFVVGVAFYLVSTVIMVSIAMAIVSLYAVCIAQRCKASTDEEEGGSDVEQQLLALTGEAVPISAAVCDLPPPYSAELPCCTCQHASTDAAVSDASAGLMSSSSAPCCNTLQQADGTVFATATNSGPHVADVSASSHAVSGGAIHTSRIAHSQSLVASCTREETPQRTRSIRHSASAPSLITMERSSRQPTSLLTCNPASPTTTSAPLTPPCLRCQPEPLLSPQELLVRYSELSTAFHFQCDTSVMMKDAAADLPPPYCQPQPQQHVMV